MEIDKKPDDGNCPTCGGVTPRPRLIDHPRASKLRTVAYWSVAVGFIISGLMVLFSIHDMDRGIGFNLMGIALMPAVILVTVSLVFPKVWSIDCGHCSKSFHRGQRDDDWVAG